MNDELLSPEDMAALPAYERALILAMVLDQNRNTGPETDDITLARLLARVIADLGVNTTPGRLFAEARARETTAD